MILFIGLKQFGFFIILKKITKLRLAMRIYYGRSKDGLKYMFFFEKAQGDTCQRYTHREVPGKKLNGWRARMFQNIKQSARTLRKKC